ncbi:MAG TPA: hypothetical protein VD884_19465 [Ohtaekwangia sp.]|nr:hypothetical protein [Ohtaekwangia sp.]
MKLLKVILIIQGGYTLLTAIWPLVDIESFMMVTGYKTDIWLVKTVGALLIPIALCMGMHVMIETDPRPVIVLSMSTAVAFIAVDFYYALNDVIADIYLADGIIETIFLLTWIYIVAFKRKSIQP